jgi:uncharacterized protein (DUF1800 family)
LKALAQSLIESPEAWAGEHRKFRTPQDWLVASLRALGVPDASDRMVAVLRQLRHPLWAPQAPKGFGDALTEWADPDSLMNRAELSRTIGRRLGGGAVDPGRLIEVIDIPTDDPLRESLADRSVPAPDRVALAIAGPAFQWR